jgi:hypothetical protein
MSKFASVRRSLLCAAALVTLAMPGLGLAAESMPGDGATPPVEAGPPPNFECSTEALTGSGPGFSSSRDQSEESAVAAWLAKAVEIYPEATWQTAYEADLSCAVQGLYSKCFARGIPCRIKPEGSEQESAEPGSGDAPGTAAEAPKSE